MTNRYELTNTWRRTLAQQENDRHETARTQLRSAFQRMRDNADKLVQQIPQDCRGLTVHDITHLDALWEMADLIAGDQFAINPVEAFAFGCSVLLHDSGMSVAAYPGGLTEIRSTIEWSDVASSVHRKRKVQQPRADFVANPSAEFFPEIVFTVLRKLHAKHAEELASISWQIPGRSERVALLQDQDLVHAYGKIIGRIAYSHHWDLDQVGDMRGSVGGPASMPPEWSLDERKVALLLRCSDAAHIDQRRAPTMLYALSRPTGVSRVHWNFQNKLNQPVRDGDTIIYTSNQDFSVDEADAWWLCFETLRMIDSEISGSNALLREVELPQFTARRVFGADRSLVCAKRVVPSGWRPIDTEIRVSNPAHLALTLGGKNLYGHGAFAPIRELLQNAVDAVRARRRLEDRDTSWGRVRLIVEQDTSDDADEVWLRVDDTGIGMSERVLVGPLLDFGQSFWNSQVLQEEFPGLESKGIDPIGKFGIGFFSVFNLGHEVRVTSRRFEAAEATTQTLAFESLSQRPILRKAMPGELPRDFSTRISVKMKKSALFAGVSQRYARALRPEIENVGSPKYLWAVLRQLVAPLDVAVEAHWASADLHFEHSPQWVSVPPETFLDEVLADVPEPARQKLIAGHAHMVRPLRGDDGKFYGRAALAMRAKETEGSPGALLSVGGLANSQSSRGGFDSLLEHPSISAASYLGVVSGDTDDATRRLAFANAPESVISSWATEQSQAIRRERHLINELMSAAHAILGLKGDPGDLPFCFSGNKPISFDQFLGLCSRANRLSIVLEHQYDHAFKLMAVTSIGALTFVHDADEQVLVVATGEMYTNALSDEAGKALRRGTPCAFHERDIVDPRAIFLFKHIKDAWKSPVAFSGRAVSFQKHSYYNNAPNYWAVSIQKAHADDAVPNASTSSAP